ncbi:MAG: OsmC family protein [Bacteroidetes bacterium]|nr:OsmC family protein [Bacteroidota bacterium]
MVNTVEITYTGNLHTEAMHVESKTRIVTDAPKDNQGMGAAFSPTDLLATSLATCILTTMAIVAKRDGINRNIDGAKAEVIKVMQPNPRRVAEIHVKVIFPKNYDEKERKILESAAHNCPVGKSLHPDLKQILQFVYPV